MKDRAEGAVTGGAGKVRTIEPRFRQLRLELGLDCTLLCRHCSVMAAPGNPHSLPEATALELIDAFADMGGEELTITGGEPLIMLRKTVHLLDQARSRGLKTVLFTSGVLRGRNGITALSTRHARTLSNRLDRIVFAVYSARPAQHDYITRVAGSHSAALTAIGRAVQAGMSVEIHFVPRRRPGSELRQLYELATTLGVSTIRVIRFVSHGRARSDAELRPTQVDLSELRSALVDVCGAGEVAVRVGPALRFLVDFAPYCTAGTQELVVGSDGQIYPCSGFLGYAGPEAIGNVFDAPLGEIWSDAPFLQAMRSLVNARVQGCSPHADGCPAQKALATGHISDETEDPDAFDPAASSGGAPQV
jgi:radical SAM protein with 4Fe4S-binding SPASM domain